MNKNIVLIESNAIGKLPEILKEFEITKPFLLSGPASFKAGGAKVIKELTDHEITYQSYVFPTSPVKPTEATVGSAIMHFDYSCDGIIGIGSGVINDTGKILARATNRPYVIIATAPSMDGYASATSSMERDGLKVSIDSTMPDAIIGDLEILKDAPLSMLQAGVGDMLAKYVSLVEWKLASIIVGERFQADIAELVEKGVSKVVESAEGLMKREPEAIKHVMEGLIIAGMAMKTAGCSRPASGVEHYFSHIWDMRSLAFPEAKSDLHGIQCGIATLLALKEYEALKTMTPDRDKALAFVASFDLDAWNEELLSFIGPGAEAMIALEEKEGKYDKKAHEKRLDLILSKWEEILSVINTLPSYKEIYDLMTFIKAPLSPEYLGYDKASVHRTFTMTKDIRDKYVLSRLLWDLGELS